ncbi:VPA1262 family protein [Leptolyngbya sp. NIES-2104]|uniref:VPA1262 family protein n=1 Tax=Leptolyngbya sp. NIES-2104 TaxID=1552121 RepID=UPI0006EC8BE8|nr:VPA1262 family protein [Leptolyngbya sp. NIES-2104]GAP96703.1 hypothetical protein NIES2104_32460 [Leptolyngbya sp. NIES-2104]
MSQSPSIPNLSQDLDTLSCDARLTEVFSGNSNEPCTLYLWLLERKQGKNDRDYQLLFSWVLPRLTGAVGQWGSFNSLSKWKSAPYEFRIHRLTFLHSGSAITDLVKRLCQGVTLGDACNQMDLPQPNAPLDQFCLGVSPNQIAQSFRVRPVIFLETSFSTLPIFDQLKPPTSPIDGISAFMGSLYRCDKLNLFCQANGEPLPQVDELARLCLNHLRDETGLDFRNADNQRLGNLEWLCFPAANQHEQSQISIDTDDAPNQVTVRITPGVLPTSSALIRCRGKNGGVIVLDQCQLVQVADSAEVPVSFEAKEHISSVTVTIWIQAPNSTSWELWYEHTSPTRWQVNLSLGLAGPQIDLPSDWLEKYANSRFRDQVEQSQKFNQVNYEQVRIGKTDTEPWIVAAKQIREFARKLFPFSSNGAFFPRGWANDETGRFSFFKWLQQLTNDPTASKVLLIDPYFDSAGIHELIARASAVQAEYVVLTTTQIKSDDDALETEDSLQVSDQSSEPQRAIRLKTACNQLQVLLKNLKFRLLDVRSTEGGKNQIFHDRYILVFGQNGDVKAGYHLSNSIQGATKAYPLLITTIPADVLPLVETYIATELLQPSNPRREVQTIFSTIAEQAEFSMSQHPTEIAAIPDANQFFAALLQDANLAYLTLSDLGERLQERGLYNTTTQEFELHETTANRVEAMLEQLTQTLLCADMDTCTRLWAGLAAWLDRTSEHEAYLAKITLVGGAALAAKLHTFVLQVPHALNLPVQSYHPNAQADALQLIDFVKRDFVSAVRDADRLLQITSAQMWQMCLNDRGLRYAAQALMTLDSAKLIDAVETLNQFLVDDRSTLDSLQFWSLAYSLSFIIQQLVWQLIINRFHNQQNDNLTQKMIESNLPSIRALAAYSLFPSNANQADQSPLDLQKIFTRLTQLSAIERIHVLAEWGFHLRIKANINRGETEAVRELRLAVFNEMRRNFPQELSLEEVSSISRRLSGPSEGAWARTTTNNLLQPLVTENKLSQDCVTEVWFLVLLNGLNNSLIIATKQDEASPSLGFNPDFTTGLELIQVCAEVFARASPERRTKWLAETLKLSQAARRSLKQPFLRSRHYEKWDAARTCALWLQSLMQLVAQTNKSNNQLTDEEFEVLQQAATHFDETLAITREADSLPDRKLLWEFTAKL